MIDSLYGKDFVFASNLGWPTLEYVTPFTFTKCRYDMYYEQRVYMNLENSMETVSVCFQSINKRKLSLTFSNLRKNYTQADESVYRK